MKIPFTSSFEVVDELSSFSEKSIKDEPMLFGASWVYAVIHGGPITQAFLHRLPREFHHDVIIDSRVHMLMPGWYPCIPGWHLDDVPRTRPDGQPEHVTPAYKAEHVLAFVGSPSKTEFLVGDLELEDVPVGGGTVYAKWHDEIEARIAGGLFRPVQIQPGEVVRFGWGGFHRGMPATETGWRFFIRASINTGRPKHNEIRKQVQVYMPAINAGW